MNEEEIIKSLGQGSYGKVYVIKKGGKQYVVKEQKFLSRHSESVAENEYKILQKIQKKCYPYLLCLIKYKKKKNSIKFFFHYNPNFYSLSNVFDSEFIFNIYQNYIMMENLLLGLYQLHKLNIAHRDIKPLNILLNPSNMATKYIDYGGACDSNDNCKRRATTPIFMSPEIAINDGHLTLEMAKKSDIWALGLTLCECFLSKTLEDVLSINNPRDEVHLEYFLQKLTQKKVNAFFKDLEIKNPKIVLYIRLIYPLLIVDWEERFTAIEALEHLYKYAETIMNYSKGSKGRYREPTLKVSEGYIVEIEKKVKRSYKPLRIKPWGKTI